MIILGVTGSIGMGKSTLGSMLEQMKIPVHDADACVHEMLEFSSPAWPAFSAAFPYFSYPSIYKKRWSWKAWRFKETGWVRGINRQALGKLVFENPELRQKLENILHPFVQQSQRDFIKKYERTGRDIVALDIPLLFETGADKRVDYVLNVSAPAFLQRQRVLSRPNMDEAKFDKIISRQMPDGEKCARADFVIHSGLGRAVMIKELKAILSKIRATHKLKEVSYG